MAAIAAGALLLAAIVAYSPWDEHRHPGGWPPAALPDLLDYAFAHVIGLVFLKATDSIDDADGSLKLNGAQDIDVFEISGRTYAAVTAFNDDGVQILDITDPHNVKAAGQIDDTDGNLVLTGAHDIDIFEMSGSTYAAVAAVWDDGVQILDITDPYNVTAAGQIDDTDGNLVLNGAHDINVFGNSTHTYAAVTALHDDGVQILDITDPYNVTAAGQIDDTDGNLELNGAHDIDVFEISGRTYAAVAALFDDGVQILDITDPYNVTAAGKMEDDGNLELNGAWGINVFGNSTHTYAAVAARDDNGVQILDIADPYNVTAAGQIDDDDSLELWRAHGINVFGNSTHTYAAVTAFYDYGVQILDVTDPHNVKAAGQILNSGDLELWGAWGIDVFEVSGSTYAAVAAYYDDGVQILDITDPYNVTAAGKIDDADVSLELDGARTIDVFEMSGRTYAAVAALSDGGVQILDVTDPSDVTPAGQIDDDDSLVLDGAYGIDIFEMSGSTYAAVTAFHDDGVQILDITDPYNVTAAGKIDNADGGLKLDGAQTIDVFEMSGSTYAAVAAFHDDGVQILDITDPYNVTAAGKIDNADGGLKLNGAHDIDVFGNSTHTYAAVAVLYDDVVQILDITDPYNVTAAGKMEDDGSLELEGAWGINVFGNSTHTYAAVAARDDNGVQILDITDPYNVTAAGQIDDDDSLELWRAHGIDVFEMSGSTYAAVTAFYDYGVQILDVTDPHNVKAAGQILNSGDLELWGAWGIDVFEVSGSTYAAVAAVFDDGVQIIRLDPPVTNSPPTAYAGPDQTVDEEQAVALDGSASDPDDDPLTYRWTHNATALDIVLDDDRATDTKFTAPFVAADTTVQFTLTVSDHHNATASDTILVAVADTGLGLAADAGLNRTVPENVLVTLNGSNSRAGTGTIASYNWTQTSGPPVTLSNDTAAEPTFTSPYVHGNTTITFTLEVSDDSSSATAAGAVTITVHDGHNEAPFARAGPDQTVDEGDIVTLNGTLSSDPDYGTILTYIWTHNATALDIVLDDDRATDTKFTAPFVTADTHIQFTLTVSDHHNATASDTILVAVADTGLGLAADAGLNRTVPENVLVTLNGSNSRAGTGTIASYNWTQTSGPPVALSDDTSAEPTFTSPYVHGNTTITFTLEVSDDTDATAAGAVTITVHDGHNEAPFVRAGPDQTVDEGDIVTLNGTLSSDPDYGTILTYNWTRILGPAVTLSDDTSATPTFTAPEVHSDAMITFNLNVTDGAAWDSTTMAVTVQHVNKPPTADAGPDQAVRNGTTVTLDGSGSSDPDSGTILTYNWTQTSGPPVTLSNGTMPTPTFTAPQNNGTILTFNLNVTDGAASDTDAVTVAVGSLPLPSVDAGPDRTADEGDTVTLSASVGDATRKITYRWLISDSAPITLADNKTLTPSFIAPEVNGTVTIRLELVITDGTSFDSDVVTVTVCDLSCPPEVHAGDGFVVTEGDAVTLSGKASDPTGDPLTYRWTHDHHSAFPISGSDTLTPSFTAPEVRKTTVVKLTLTATDDSGVGSSDSLNMLVSDTPPTKEGPTGAACGSAPVRQSFTFPNDTPGGHYSIGISVRDEIMYVISQRISSKTALHEIRAFNISSGFERVDGLTTPLPSKDNFHYDIWAGPNGRILALEDNQRIWNLAAGSSPGNSLVDAQGLDGINDPGGIWSDHTLDRGYVLSGYVQGGPGQYINAYDHLGDGMANRIPSHDIHVYQINRIGGGLWSDGDTIWTTDFERCVVMAYDLDTKERVPALDINGTVGAPRGLAGDPDNNRMWVLGGTYRVAGYDMPTTGGASNNAPPDPVRSSHDLIEGKHWTHEMAASQKGYLTASGDVPVGFALDRDGRSLSWTPSAGQAGSYTVRVTGSANGGAAVLSEAIISLSVAQNAPPNIVFYLPSEQTINLGQPYLDEGVVCEDDVDEPRQVFARAAPNTAIPGVHTLTYECADSFGHRAVPATRTLTVVDPSTITNSTAPNTNATDSTPPTLSLNPGNSTVLQHDPYGDPGAACTDDTDPPRVVYADPPLDTSLLGPHLLTYKCTDDAGNRADLLKRSVLVRAPPPPTNSTVPTPATNSTVPTPATNSTVPITPATNSTTPVTPATNSTTPVTPATNSTTPVTPATNSTTPVTPVTNSTVPITPATNSTVPITPVTNSTVPITNTNSTTPVTPPPNRPPVLLEIADRTVAEHSKISFVVSASDDLEDTLTYSASGLPKGASFNEMTGLFKWTPSERQGPGDYHITFGVTDGTDAGQPHTATITVTESNRPPRIEGRAAEGYRCNTAPGDTVTATITVTDPDLPAQDLEIASGTGDIGYTADISGGTLTFGATIPDDPLEIPYDHRFIFFLTVSDGHDPPGTANLSIFLYLPEAGESAWPDC